MRKVFVVNKKDRSIINEMLSDDLVGRQSIYEREGVGYKLKTDEVLIVFSGSEEAFSKIKEQWGGKVVLLSGKQEEDILTQIDRENDNAQDGMGFLSS